MARVLVLSRNAAIAMGLSTAELDVVDSRPDATDSWIDTAHDVDVVVMQPDATFDAATAVHKLRRSASRARALVIAPQTASWPDPTDSERLAVSRLDLPMSLTLLLSEVNRLATLPAFDPSTVDLSGPNGMVESSTPSGSPDEELTVETVPAADDLGVDTAFEEDDEADLDPLAVHDAGRTEDLGDDKAESQSTVETVPESVEAERDVVDLNAAPPAAVPAEAPAPPQPPSEPAAPDPLTAPLETLVVGSPSRWLYGQWSPSDYQPPADPGLAAEASPASASPGPALSPVARLGEAELGMLIAELLDRKSQLISLAEIGEIVLSECVARTCSDAGALLCRDGEVWRVAAGSDLRPLEHRLQLDDSHWLVHTLREDQKAVLIEDSDIVRERLHGAPLASWEQLAAVPLPDLDVFVILARRADAYAADVIQSVLEVADEARSMLKDAITVRELARELAPLTDPVD